MRPAMAAIQIESEPNPRIEEKRLTVPVGSAVQELPSPCYRGCFIVFETASSRTFPESIPDTSSQQFSDWDFLRAVRAKMNLRRTIAQSFSLAPLSDRP